MEQITKYMIIIVSLTTVQFTVKGSENEGIQPSMKRLYYSPVIINVCDNFGFHYKLRCYCDSKKPKMATRADCWLFEGDVTEENLIWPSFSSQSEIEHLIFNVRSDNALTFIPAKALVRLDKLKNISIQFGNIKKIPPYAFTNSSTVRQIVLKSNKISTLEKHSFAQMMMLSILSLDENQISELKRDVFFGLPNLHVLHLSNNNISLIHEGCFKHLNNLIELNLDYNYISVVTREMLEGLENLSRLNLRNNILTMVGNLAFSELWGLKELMLDNNTIEYISERAFGGLTQLRKLTLSGNKLTTFYEDILEDIRSLIILDLRYNMLEVISYETVRPVVENDKPASTAVYLEGNPLSCNCRLSWIYALRNETRDITLRNALETVSCVTELNTKIHLNDQEDNENVKDGVVPDNTYNHYDKNDNNAVRKFTKKTIKLTDIPLETLPCPKELKQTDKYGHPLQNEIRVKAFSNVEKISPCLILVLFTLLCLF